MQIYEIFSVLQSGMRTMRLVVVTNKEEKMIGRRKVRCRSSFQAELGPSYARHLSGWPYTGFPLARHYCRRAISYIHDQI